MPAENPDPQSPVARAMLSFIRCLGARERHEVYLSTPITTGRAFVAWRKLADPLIRPGHPRYESLHYDNVTARNIARIPPLLDTLRRRYPDRLVIDPTSLADIDGWQQEDYHRFWCTLIARYAAITIFAADWQFSTGCINEFAAALASSAQIYSESLTPLTKKDGTALIEAAIDELDGTGIDAEPLRSGLRAVYEAADGETAG